MKITTPEQLSSFLRDTRSNKNLSQGKVGSKVGIRQTTVSNFEQNPSSSKLDTVFKILSALELELEVRPRGEADSPMGSSSEWKEEW
ncbi:helix-turn-helix domain-containing protein [Ferrimonas sediminicola]|uniref:Helix-turn-helix domain-containing protein n=1 Tax=Ferrimonas sediminicola TaxID=2569538 RepID=A0A4U1BBK8_9GAMM|nr:helix-turn-helix domain-containing protein [Ferrimonas sediminicola]TKB47984.1 helix-turn-helix domain-containing protein [Ferrimonas sediminicola]